MRRKKYVWNYQCIFSQRTSLAILQYSFWDIIKLDTNSLVRCFGLIVTIQETICIFVRPICRDNFESTWHSCLDEDKSEIVSMVR